MQMGTYTADKTTYRFVHSYSIQQCQHYSSVMAWTAPCPKEAHGNMENQMFARYVGNEQSVRKCLAPPPPQFCPQGRSDRGGHQPKGIGDMGPIWPRPRRTPWISARQRTLRMVSRKQQWMFVRLPMTTWLSLMEKDDGLKILYFTVVEDLTFIKVESWRIYCKSYSWSHHHKRTN